MSCLGMLAFINEYKKIFDSKEYKDMMEFVTASSRSIQDAVFPQLGEYTNANDITPKIVENFSKAYNELSKRNNLIVEEKLKYELTREQTDFIENDLKINLNTYPQKSDNVKERRFSRSELWALLSILVTILAMIQAQIFHNADEEQSEKITSNMEQIIEKQDEYIEHFEEIIQNQKLSDEEIEQLEEKRDKTNELLEAILEQLEDEE